MSKNICWKCEKDISKSTVFCDDCGSVQPVSNDENYFEKFGLPIDFEIGRKNLDVAYFALQRKLHPDLFVNKSEKEKTLSTSQTMDLNEGFDILKNPLKRAEYILALNGMIVNKDGQGVKPSQEILMESLEIREEIEHADEQKLRKIAVKTAEDKIECIADITKQLKDKDFDAAAQSAIKLRYLEKLIEEVRR